MTEKHDVVIDNGSAPVTMAEPMGSVTKEQPGVTTTTTTTQYTTSGPGGQVHYDQQEKLGSKCCGFCCDMRRAVIILNIIFLVLNIISIISYVAGRTLTGNLELEDDTLNQELEDSYTYAAIFSGITIAVSIATILGANRYNMILVGLGAFWLVAQFIANIVVGVTTWSSVEEDYQGTSLPSASLYYTTYIFQGIITSLFLYPHVGLMMEIKKGIMTPETYPREEFSCCCV